jgi:hypothetical protein
VYLRLLALEVAVTDVWLTAKQAAEIVETFPAHNLGQVQVCWGPGGIQFGMQN